MRRSVKEWWVDVQTEVMWLFCRMVSMSPYWLRYRVLQVMIYWVLRYVIHYRQALIMRQLAASFPEKSEDQLRDICNNYYRSLSEMIVNTLSIAGISDAERESRVTFDVSEDVERAFQSGNVVVLTSHFGFWEYATYAKYYFQNHNLVVAYHPIKSAPVDRFYKRVRTMDRVVPVPSRLYMRYAINSRNGIDGHPVIFGLVADQNCPPTKDCKWHDFLNQDTLFFDGGEVLARKFGMPVFYLGMERIKAGYYCLRFKQIYDGVEQLPEGEITSRYARLLEQDIRRSPELWMWSHNRWKFKNCKCGTKYKPIN